MTTAWNQLIQADLDGNGNLYWVDGGNEDPCETLVTQNGISIWDSVGWIDGWNRRPWDTFTAVDIDMDGKDEIVLFNGRDGWTGVMKWASGAMHIAWASPSPLTGFAGEWLIRGDEVFTATMLGGLKAVAISDGISSAWLTWQTGALGIAYIIARYSVVGSIALPKKTKPPVVDRRKALPRERLITGPKARELQSIKPGT